MKFIVLTGQYPNNSSPYRHGFVHTRNLWYLRFGHEVTVLVPSKQENEYVYENVRVFEGPVLNLIKKMNQINADVYCIHLLLHRIEKTIDGGALYDWLLKKNTAVLFFIHGVETQKIWKSRRGDLQWRRPATFARMIYRDLYLIQRMKKTLFQFLNYPGCRFIAPSKWMFEESYQTTNIDVTNKGVVIPNGIDTKLFHFTDRWKDRNKLLAIRPLTLQAKYAVDLFIESASKSTKALSFNLYGNGPDNEFKEIEKRRLKKAKNNLKIHRFFIKNVDIPQIHQNHGIYCAVTRMDAQGVSMCEAMSSGLPTVSFDITAISEFIQHGTNGFLAKAFDVDMYSNYLSELAEDRQLFDKIAQGGRKSMEKIDIRKTSQREIELAKTLTS